MAIVTTQYYVPSVGMAWKGAVDDFVSYVAGTVTSYASSLVTVFPYKALRIDMTSGSDTIRHEYILAGIAGTGQCPFWLVMQESGWRYMPAPMPATFAGGSTQSNWNTLMVAVRQLLLVNLCSASNDGYTQESITGTLGMNAACWHGAYYRREVVAVDAMLIYVYSSALEFNVLVGLVTDGLSTGQPVAVGGGGGSFDDSNIVEALQDIATQSVDYTANNGSAIFSLRGKVNTET